MPLIDRTYFTGELNIPKTDEVFVQEVLDGLILKREPELLKKLLGYPLYKSFTAGLLLDPIPVQWSNLLLGCEYLDGQRQWRGLVSALPVGINAVLQANEVPVIADSDAVTSQTIAVPVDLVGRPWRIAKRPIGSLREDEYDVSSDGTAVAFSTPIALNDTYFFYANNISLQQSTPGTKQSLIANYVYFFYMTKESSQSTAIGEVVSVSENSQINGSGRKVNRAWNEMVEIIHELICFLDANKADYSGWNSRQRWEVLDEFRYITRF